MTAGPGRVRWSTYILSGNSARLHTGISSVRRAYDTGAAFLREPYMNTMIVLLSSFDTEHLNLSAILIRKITTDTTHVVAVGLIVVVRAARRHIDVPRVRRTVLGRRPVIGRPRAIFPHLLCSRAVTHETALLLQCLSSRVSQRRRERGFSRQTPAYVLCMMQKTIPDSGRKIEIERTHPLHMIPYPIKLPNNQNPNQKTTTRGHNARSSGWSYCC